jgi:WD40 repeat protein
MLAAQTGALIRTLKGHKARVVCVSIFDDLKRIVSASWDNTIKVWNADSGDQIHTLVGQLNVKSVVISNDGRRIISNHFGREGIKTWNAKSGELINSFFFSCGGDTCLAFY